MFLLDKLSKPFNKGDIEYGEEFVPNHGLPFYRDLWEYVLDTHKGFLPLKIRAVPEGTPVPTKNVLLTVESTDPKVWWIGDHLETSLLRGFWYPTTVCTNSFISKQIILPYLKETGTPELISTRLSDFGARGVSSEESAGIGGAAHLVNFDASDNVTGIQYARYFYNRKLTGLESIPAMQHSTVTSWGRENEVEAYRNMIRQYGRPGAIFACVIDSYNSYDACEKLWGEQLRQELIDSGSTAILRSDSGDPILVIPRLIEILGNKFGFTIHKGYKLLNNVRLFQSDGINHQMISRILFILRLNGWSADNIGFGQGGDLLQNVTRDTQGFAMKNTSILTKGNDWMDVYKDPITDAAKKSFRGRVDLVNTSEGFKTRRENSEDLSVLRTVYENGEVFHIEDMETIQARATL
jgi:nicotinamide phosphoribosyltransferase